MGRSIVDVVAAAPLYRDLTREEIDELIGGLELRAYAPGEALMVQGAASDGAYVLSSGAVAVAARLPGGGELEIAEFGPGDLVGEMSLLLRGGKRTATARALTAVEAVFTDHRYFEAGLHLLRPSSLKVLRRLGLTIADRLRTIRTRSRVLVDAAPDDGLFRVFPSGGDAASTVFEVRPFLPIMPCLSDFSPDELDALYDIATVEHVRRGVRLVGEGEAVDAPRLVVRGALLLGQERGAKVHQLDILGPGRFAGVAPVLESAPAGASVIAAEDSTILAFDPEKFVSLWRGADRLALRLLDAVNGELVQALNTASNHLTRLTAQARVREIVAHEG